MFQGLICLGSPQSEIPSEHLRSQLTRISPWTNLLGAWVLDEAGVDEVRAEARCSNSRPSQGSQLISQGSVKAHGCKLAGTERKEFTNEFKNSGVLSLGELLPPTAGGGGAPLNHRLVQI